ncbi:MAG: hypothetical protein VB071_12830 [Lawsonibacter sp.]|nr:hypothetical protein [Lawsonibacter sp.]
MKQKNIKDSGQKQKRGTVLGAGIFVLFQMGSFFALLWLCILSVYAWLKVLLLVLAAANLIIIPLVLIVLKQRIKEIEGGEFDAASQY